MHCFSTWPVLRERFWDTVSHGSLREGLLKLMGEEVVLGDKFTFFIILLQRFLDD